MKRLTGRNLRHKRIRNRIYGTAEKPRLYVYRSLSNLTAQLVDDINNCTLLSLSTQNKEIQKKVIYGGNVKAADFLGTRVGEMAKEKGINQVVFDRGGYLYHGRVKAFAEACRKTGLKF